MYESHWNLDQKPFDNDQNVGFFYESKHHREAQVRVLYAAEQRKSLALLIGESGLGKTIVCRTAAAALGERNGLPAWVCASGLKPETLISTVAAAFGLNATSERYTALTQLTSFLAQQAEKGTQPVLFIDNAEDLTSFDELRTLLDLVDAQGRHLLTVILCGHPRVRGSLKRLHSLVQRLEVGYELLPLDEEEAKAYVTHRLQCANVAPEDLFDEEALDAVARLGEGTPRLINRLCDLALLMGMIEKHDRLTSALIEEARNEMGELRRLGTGQGRSGGRDRDDRGRGRDRDRDDRGRGRDRDDRDSRSRGRDRDDRGRGRDRDDRGRGRDRDSRGGRGRDRDDRGGRGRDDRDDRGGRGRGRDRDDRGGRDSQREPSNAKSDDAGGEEHSDIESMHAIIQNNLKVVSGGNNNRRRRSSKSARPERGDPLKYFDSNVDDEEDVLEGAEEEAPTSTKDDDQDKGARGRGRRRGRRRDDDSNEAPAKPAKSDDDDAVEAAAGGGEGFAAGLLDED